MCAEAPTCSKPYVSVRAQWGSGGRSSSPQLHMGRRVWRERRRVGCVALHRDVTLTRTVLHEEMRTWMRMLGVTRLDQLGPQYVDISKL